MIARFFEGQRWQSALDDHNRGGHRLFTDGLLCPSNVFRVILCNVPKNIRVNLRESFI